MGTLSLRANDLREEGAGHLAGALRKNTGLGVLDLSSNEFGEAGGASLLAALREDNWTLTELRLYSCEVKREQEAQIEEVLQRNSSGVLGRLLSLAWLPASSRCCGS